MLSPVDVVDSAQILITIVGGYAFGDFEELRAWRKS